MMGPCLAYMLCQTDEEFVQLDLRIEYLATNAFFVKANELVFEGHCVRAFKADRVSRLFQVQFHEALLDQLKIVPLLAGVPFDFELNFMQLEHFLASYPGK